ncbi:MAG: ATP-grasp domain-containing protein [Burkholderiaceae bacterium]|nr:ATP-grasp domain-containing protein [Burkholderiaceae bacterium]
MYEKILIANRGEIACRIARTLRRMGISVATVHSTADANALHVREIGESILIGEGPARESYLDVEAILRAAQACRADAIHPGFGFLSENPLLARRCADLGIEFIGPDAQALELFGDKAAAKTLAKRLGVPTADGSSQATDDVDQVMVAVGQSSLPCVVKAVQGGGGKGMRVIRSLDTARGAVEAAIREGRSSFGDGRVIVERYLERPRHIEVQILGDGRGNVVHLYDRECSLQRRHQKVIEEAPVCSIPDAVRQRLWAHSVELCQAMRYRGLGTVEFAVTPDAAVFLEVNPRLQVEHPVTESVLGLDLVELQVRTLAEGRLPMPPEQVPVPRGHAVQARLYAEDPRRGFLPSTGRIEAFRVGPGVRADIGVVAGCDISPHYDPMIAKLIAHDDARDKALLRLREALAQTVVLGVVSNRSFLLELLDTAQARNNDVDTETIDRWIAASGAMDEGRQVRHVAALMAIWRRETSRGNGPDGAWSDPSLTGWRLSRGRASRPSVDEIGLRHVVSTPSGRHRVGFGATTGNGAWPVRVDDEIVTVTMGPVLADGSCLVELDGSTLRLTAACRPQHAWATMGDEQITLDIAPLHSARKDAHGDGVGAVLAPMMGMVIAIHVDKGQRVKPGDPLATIESMKMEMPIVAAAEGEVGWIGCSVGGKVERNQELFRIADAS